MVALWALALLFFLLCVFVSRYFVFRAWPPPNIFEITARLFGWLTTANATTLIQHFMFWIRSCWNLSEICPKLMGEGGSAIRKIESKVVNPKRQLTTLASHNCHQHLLRAIRHKSSDTLIASKTTTTTKRKHKLVSITSCKQNSKCLVAFPSGGGSYVISWCRFICTKYCKKLLKLLKHKNPQYIHFSE